MVQVNLKYLLNLTINFVMLHSGSIEDNKIYIFVIHRHPYIYFIYIDFQEYMPDVILKRVILTLK